MKITYDRGRFFASIRPLFGRLNDVQVDGLNYLLDAWETQYPSGSLKYLAYCLATTFHETAETMLPIEEYGKGRGRKYGPTGFYGRGYVQLTWDYNYEKASKRLKELFGIEVDLVKKPELALDPKLAALILYVGSIEGWFTGKKLSDYFRDGVANPTDARRIINGTDKAELIAGYYHRFVRALLDSEEQRESEPLPLEKPQASKVVASGTKVSPKNAKK